MYKSNNFVDLGSPYENVLEEYFLWLCDLVLTDGKYKFKHILKLLHAKAFVSIVPNDDNRAADGKKLREVFADEVGDPDLCKTLDGPCSVLEMLVALSQRIAIIMGDPENPEDTSRWFEELLRNLELLKTEYSKPLFKKEKKKEVEAILNRFLERKYSPDGRGGLFPLKDAKKDQTTVEIWYQLMGYLEEYYSD